jgi:hypothetical protein
MAKKHKSTLAHVHSHARTPIHTHKHTCRNAHTHAYTHTHPVSVETGEVAVLHAHILCALKQHTDVCLCCAFTQITINTHCNKAPCKQLAHRAHKAHHTQLAFSSHSMGTHNTLGSHNVQHSTV